MLFQYLYQKETPTDFSVGVGPRLLIVVMLCHLLPYMSTMAMRPHNAQAACVRDRLGTPQSNIAASAKLEITPEVCIVERHRGREMHWDAVLTGSVASTVGTKVVLHCRDKLIPVHHVCSNHPPVNEKRENHIFIIFHICYHQHSILVECHCGFIATVK